MQTAAVNGGMSEMSSVTSGVPEGSVLGPILFLLYTADVARFVKMHRIDIHSYADESQLYLHAKANEIFLTFHRIIRALMQ